MRLIIVDNKKENKNMKNEVIALLEGKIRFLGMGIEEEEEKIKICTDGIEKAKASKILFRASIKQLEEALKRLNK